MYMYMQLLNEFQAIQRELTADDILVKCENLLKYAKRESKKTIKNLLDDYTKIESPSEGMYMYSTSTCNVHILICIIFTCSVLCVLYMTTF